jgi:hypothetical protein
VGAHLRERGTKRHVRRSAAYIEKITQGRTCGLEHLRKYNIAIRGGECGIAETISSGSTCGECKLRAHGGAGGKSGGDDTFLGEIGLRLPGESSWKGAHFSAAQGGAGSLPTGASRLSPRGPVCRLLRGLDRKILGLSKGPKI